MRTFGSDRTNVALFAVFALASAFCVWIAADTVPLALNGSPTSPYNELADAFLHLHLWVARAPAALTSLPEPYNPQEHLRFIAEFPDYALYGHYLYLTWGPAPVLVWLLPLHLLGFEPSESVIIAPFAIVGLGFSLATLRVLLRQIGNVALWMSLLAAFTLAFCSAVPYDAGFPSIYHEDVAAGFCFAMAGIWLAMSAIAGRRASTVRLVLMSLCFGLAAGSRPPLGLLALVLVPVYMSLRDTQTRRRLLIALGAPVGASLLLLALYNQARFGSPLQYGTKFQLGHEYAYLLHWGELSYVPPGLWSYLIAPPKLSVLFPFIVFIAPQISYPASLPAEYLPISEGTGALLPLTPVAFFLLALPWVWRRRPTLLGGLALPLLVLAGVGIVILLFLSYVFFSTTERYEVDYTTLLLFGALAVWLALSVHVQGRWRRLIRVGGGLLAGWGCLTGVAISFNELGEKHTGTWHTLVSITSPASTAIAAVAGHPVLGEIYTPNTSTFAPESYSSIATNATAFWLDLHQQADLTIASPSSGEATLVADVEAGPALKAGASLEASVRGPGHASYRYRLPIEEAQARIPLHLQRGINRVFLSPVAGAVKPGNPAAPESRAVVVFSNLALAGN